MATVHLGRDLRHERQVAVMVPRPDVAGTVGSGRFFQEVRGAADLQRPHILPLFHSGEAAGASAATYRPHLPRTAPRL